jgi:hypothetical protein
MEGGPERPLLFARTLGDAVPSVGSRVSVRLEGEPHVLPVAAPGS